MQRLSATLTSAALALSLSSTPIQAKDGEKTAAIAGIIALGLLGAAAAKHQHRENREDYTPHPMLHEDENASGRCMHKAERQISKVGGYSASLDRVDHVKVNDRGQTVVKMHVTGYFPAGNKTTAVRCVIEDGRILKFEHEDFKVAGHSSGMHVSKEWDRGCSDAKVDSYDRSRHSHAYEDGWQACK